MIREWTGGVFHGFSVLSFPWPWLREPRAESRHAKGAEQVAGDGP